MSAIGSQPVTLRVAALIGALEAVGLAAYAVSIVVFEAGAPTSGIKGSDLAPGVLIGLYLIFAALVFVVSFAFVTGRAAARTPFLLVQLFAVVVSQPLFSSAGARPIGVILIAAAAAAFGCALTPSARKALR